MASDMIEICSKCGKMPRGIDLTAAGLFRCTRCGNTDLRTVTNSDYEKIVTGLDQRYHAEMVQKHIEHVKAFHPMILRPVAGKKAVEKKARPAKRTVKKAAKKKAKKRKK